jgi:sarcosine oxidase subunit gamma
VIEVEYPVSREPATFRGVTISLARPWVRFSVRARAADGLPNTVLTSAAFGEGHALCLGPEEWLVLLPEGAGAPILAGLHAVTDIGHRNVGLTIEGTAAVALLLTGCALDLERDFPIGKVTRTLYESVEIVLWRTGSSQFHVEVWRSFAPYLWAALELAAGDLG